MFSFTGTCATKVIPRSSTAWRIVTNAETGRDDIVVTQYIMNTAPPGSEPVHADATLRANGVRQHRRIVSGLERWLLFKPLGSARRSPTSHG